MPAAAKAAADEDDLIVGKRDLCERLGWSRPTLDHRLKVDPSFPVRTVGDRSGGWEFEVETVEAYLQGRPRLAIDIDDEPEAAEVVPLPPGRMQHDGEATARQRRDTVQAQLMEDRLRKQRGELMETAEVKAALATAVTKLSTALNALPDVLARRLGLPEASASVMRQEVEEARRQFFGELRSLLTDG